MTVKVNPLSESELAVAFSGPAPFCNRFFINISAIGVRFAFAEQGAPEAESSFRSGVFMPRETALALRDVLTQLLETPSAEGQASSGGPTLQ